MTAADKARAYAERFWSKVDRRGPNECWEWQAAKLNGYGAFSIRRKQLRAHRIAYELLVGKIADELVLDHLCRNKSCVNPAHLEPVTMRENTLRGQSIVAKNAMKTECANGHKFVPGSFRIYTGKNRIRRACIQCKLIEDRKYKAKLKRKA